MRYRKLGKCDDKVSAIGLGGMAMTPIYGPVDPVEATAAVNAALDDGMNFIDTSDAYGAESLSKNDWRHDHPRLQKGNIDENIKLVAPPSDLAAERGVSQTQLCLVWLLHQSEDMFPIPGTKRRGHILENCAAVEIQLSDEEVFLIGENIKHKEVSGTRYPGKQLGGLGI